MKLYADTPPRRHRQILADVFVLLWIVCWIWAATRMYSLLIGLAEPGTALESGGNTMSEHLASVGEQINAVPVVGDGLRAPFDEMSETALSLAAAGAATRTAVERVALFSALGMALIPIMTMLALWLPLRIRFARRAAAAQRFIDSADDMDLFALRALTRQPMHVLARIDDDPAGAWRRRDPLVINSLAVLELKDAGLHPPPGLAPGTTV